MKYILIIISLLAIAGCEKRTSELHDRYSLPDDLKHCKVYLMESKSGRDLTVIHCPNSTTTTKHSCGKNCTTDNIVIEENVYD